MATTPPPDEPTRTGYGSTMGGRGDALSRMPIPVNPELLVYLLVWIIIAIIWAASDEVGAGTFATLTVALTFGYLVSRGIAKASRVHED